MAKFIASILLLSLTGEFFITPVIKADGPTVLISEVCTDPQSDWLTNQFSGVAGDGSITSSDEFIEIVNVSSQAVDLTGWSIKIEDSTVDTDAIDASLVKNEEIEGDITQFPVGQYYILGNPVGSMNNDVKVELYDNLDNLVDSVTLGDFDDGNLEDNAVDGNATSSQDEVVARNYHNQDTNLDLDDFRKNYQTMGQQNPEWEEEAEEPEIPGQTPVTPIEYSDQVIISEILPNPTGLDSEGEFIELFNVGQKEIDLEGWLLGDSSSRIYIINQGDFPSTIIPAESYWAIFRTASGIALNNSGDQVVLYHPDQNVVDQIEYSQSYEGQSYAKIDNQWKWTSAITPDAVNDYQIQNEPPEAKIDIESKEIKVRQIIKLSTAGSEDPDGDELTFVWNLGNEETKEGEEIEHSYQNEGEYKIELTVIDVWGTKDQTEVTITVTDYDYSDKILINELLPNPEENDRANEWIELVNLGAEQVDLEGWQLTDERTEYFFPTNSVIKADSYLVVFRTDSKIGLNNSGDKLLLIDPAGKVINGVEYTSAKAGLSFARVNDRDWLWTDTPTEGGINQFTLEEEEIAESADSAKKDGVLTVNLKQIQELESGDLVMISGVVTVEPGVLGKNIFYLMDETGGVQIYCSGDCPDVDLGDELKVAGKISVSQGNKRIKAKKEDVEIIGQREIVPVEVAISDIENYINSLVKIRGQVLSIEKSNIYLSDEEDETGAVYLKRSTGLKNSLFKEGQQVLITGIVELNKEEVRLLPRCDEDIEIQGQVLGEGTEKVINNEIDLSQPENKNNKLTYIILIIILAVGGVGYYFWQRRRKED